MKKKFLLLCQIGLVLYSSYSLRGSETPPQSPGCCDSMEDECADYKEAEQVKISSLEKYKAPKSGTPAKLSMLKPRSRSLEDSPFRSVWGGGSRGLSRGIHRSESWRKSKSQNWGTTKKVKCAALLLVSPQNVKRLMHSKWLKSQEGSSGQREVPFHAFVPLKVLKSLASKEGCGSSEKIASEEIIFHGPAPVDRRRISWSRALHCATVDAVKHISGDFDGHYILCAGYWGADGSRGDIQWGITGKQEPEDNYPLDAAIRELYEETGIRENNIRHALNRTSVGKVRKGIQKIQHAFVFFYRK